MPLRIIPEIRIVRKPSQHQIFFSFDMNQSAVFLIPCSIASGSMFNVQRSRFKVQRSTFNVQGSRFKVQGSRLDIGGYAKVSMHTIPCSYFIPRPIRRMKGLSRLFVVPDVFPEKLLDSMVIIIHMARSRLKAKL